MERKRKRKSHPHLLKKETTGGLFCRYHRLILMRGLFAKKFTFYPHRTHILSQRVALCGF
ncbi:MAG: hypothetical protein BGO67_13195 [Alphaproteobacteria bacterium 41-28]|nr:MAG: hypothetical protein BGO67_13195 [Alphaproteobacteria bacterium 41-28]